MLKHVKTSVCIASFWVWDPGASHMRRAGAKNGTRHSTGAWMPLQSYEWSRWDSIRFDHQKMWLADFFGWSQKSIDGVECSKWCKIKDVNSNSNISWSLVAAFYMFLSGIHIFSSWIPLVALFAHSCQPFLTLQIWTVLNRYEDACSVTVRSPWESWRMRAEIVLVLQPSPSAPWVSDMVRYGQWHNWLAICVSSVEKKTHTVPQQ